MMGKFSVATEGEITVVSGDYLLYNTYSDRGIKTVHNTSRHSIRLETDGFLFTVSGDVL